MAFDAAKKLAERKFAAALTALAPKLAGEPMPDRVGGDIEADDKAEADAVRGTIAAHDKRVAEVDGAEFYATAVFLTKEQRDAFLAAMPSVTRIEGGRYIDGLSLAAAIGIAIPPARPTSIKPARPDKSALAVGIIPDYPA